MAKRTDPGEKPYRPLIDADLVNAAISPTPPSLPAVNPPAPKIVQMTRPQAVPRVQHITAEPVIVQQEQVRVISPALVEKIDQPKKVLFTRSESQAIDRLVTSLATRLNVQLKASHVMRALTGLLLNAEAEIDRRAGEVGSIIRPANGDAQALVRFEREIGKIIAAAIRDAGPIRE